MKAFEYVEPRTIEDAVGWLAFAGGRSRVLAGGTDLLVRLKRRVWEVDRLVNLKRVDALRGVRGEAQWTSIGPLTTISELARSVVIAARHPVLAEAALQMSSPQVRNLATVGGNLCNASPAADMAPPLLCLQAQLRVVGPRWERTVSLSDFFIGPGRTVMGPEEMLAEIRVPVAEGRGVFIKFSPRRAMDLALVSVACVRVNGTVRVAVGAAAPTPILVPPTPEAAVAACSPIDDVRGSAEYRRHLVRVLVGRALEGVK